MSPFFTVFFISGLPLVRFANPLATESQLDNLTSSTPKLIIYDVKHENRYENSYEDTHETYKLAIDEDTHEKC